jgi:flavodoxin I
MKKENQAIIVYGTGSGNTELVADCIAEGMEQVGVKTEAVKAEVIGDANRIQNFDLVVLACSTWNVGHMQPYYYPFYKELVKMRLDGKAMAVVGLGDSENYDIFCGVVDYLEDAVKKTNGQQIVPTLKVDGPPHSKLTEYKHWGEKLAQEFLQNHA